MARERRNVRLMATIGARLAERDRRRFVGRNSELAFLGRCLDGESDASVVLIHGPGGIGKSTLLRELARRAGAGGRRAHFVEGRELAPAPRALDAALAAAREEAEPLVLIDTYERMTALDGYLRGTVVPSLPERALVVIAGRERPSRGWLEGGWESLAVQLELSGLSADEAQELLSLHGVDDAGRIDELVMLGEGLAAGAGAGRRRRARRRAGGGDGGGRRRGGRPAGRPRQRDEIDRPELMRALIRRLAEAEIDGPHLGPLAVAAIARVTTIDMLRDVLPDSDAVQAYMWLRERSFAEPLGDGIALHELVRKALHGRSPPPRPRARARPAPADRRPSPREGGRRAPAAVDRPLHLVENEAIRWGFSWDGSGEHRLDEVRPGDAEAVRQLLGERRAPERWGVLEPYFRDAPERIAIVRDLGDRIRGFELSVTSANAPPIAAVDPQLGPWLAHARATGARGRAVLWQAAVDFTADPRTGCRRCWGCRGSCARGWRTRATPICRSIRGSTVRSASRRRPAAGTCRSST